MTPRAMRQFVGIDLGREPVPDETTICKFRHLLEAHQLGEQLFALIRTYLAEQGLQISRGTIVGRHDYQCAEFNEESHQGAGSGDASDEKGQPVVLRDEGPYRGWIAAPN
jgi:IS5 family transposase